MAANPPPEPEVCDDPEPKPSLVDRLSGNEHRVVASRAADGQELLEQPRSGFVLLKLPETQGGTELGIAVNPEFGSELTSAEELSVSGELTLAYVPVRVQASIRLKDLEGRGGFQRL
jgi:hypothetical protein